MVERADRLVQELTELLGEDGLFRLTHAYGGFRLWVPSKIKEDGDLAQELGMEIAQKLCQRYSPDSFKVPVCREFRAKVLLRRGHSARWVARSLGLTESGMEKLVARLRKEGFDCSSPANREASE
jgi:hypothetical protein